MCNRGIDPSEDTERLVEVFCLDRQLGNRAIDPSEDTESLYGMFQHSTFQVVTEQSIRARILKAAETFTVW